MRTMKTILKQNNHLTSKTQIKLTKLRTNQNTMNNNMPINKLKVPHINYSRDSNVQSVTKVV